MTWSDLVARLAAARDLRKELAADRDEEAASFDVYSARCLAERAGEKEFVNPETSTNRKGIGPISVESVETDTDGLPAETRGNR